MKHKTIINILIISCFCANVIFIPVTLKRYNAVNIMYKLIEYDNGDYENIKKYESLYNILNWNPLYHSIYGDCMIKQMNYEGAKLSYEKSIECYYDPYIIEKIGVIHMALTNNEGAIRAWNIEGQMIPWRISAKYYLSKLQYSIGNTNEAIRNAQLVVNIPLKKYTDQGVEMKKSAQDMLKTLGVLCEDPGIKVFDINDKSTWNEGKW